MNGVVVVVVVVVASRCSARSYVVHHTQRISLAAAMYDAMAIRKKQKIAAPAAPTDDARA